MASALAAPLSLHSYGGIPRRSSMELCVACHLLTFRRSCGLHRFGYPRRFLPSYKWQWMQQQNDLKVIFHPGISSHLSRSTLMTPMDGGSVICKGVHKVLWSIEADLADGYLLFITGDPVSLGCWEPDMAIHLSRCSGHANLWTSEIKVPCGTHFKYNYFIKDKKKHSRDIVWRPGPDFSLSIPSFVGENEVIVVRDFWMKTRKQGPPIPSWGSWMLDIDIPDNHIKHGSCKASSAGDLEILRSPNGAPLLEEQLSVNYGPKEECKLLDKDAKINSEGSEEKLSEQEQPVEEPWLLQSTVFSFSDSCELDEAISQEEQHPEDEHKVVRIEEPASTVILVNSSVCTMQRIALLEDDKLVELLLEPVNSDVQCGNIYLGVLTKFAPRMGGVFVDIGISRSAFMDIKQNREPFAYPFHDDIVPESSNNSNKLEPKVNLDSHGHDYASYDNDVTGESLEVDHLDEHEVADELYVSDAIETNTHNEIIDLNGVEADSGENSEEHGNHIEDEYTDDVLPVEAESSNNSGLALLAQQSWRDSVDIHIDQRKWGHVRVRTKIIVQVVKEQLGRKPPSVTAYPTLRSRFLILMTRHDGIGVSSNITGAERTRLKLIAKALKPPGFGLTIRTVAEGHSLGELKKDLDDLISTWKGIVEHAKSAALAAEEGVEGAVPVMLNRAMGQTLSVVQDYFNEKVKRMVVDSAQTYHEVTCYLQKNTPELCSRVELYDKRIPIFDEYNIEEEINNIINKRVPLSNGGHLVIEQTEALVSIDVNGGQRMLGNGTSQEKAVLDVNLAAVKQIARELRLRDIGGIIVVDFIDMADESNRRLVYAEMKKEVERDRSMVNISELSKLGLMEIARQRVRPSVTFKISEACTCCQATGRVEALETSLSKIEREILRCLAVFSPKVDPENSNSWPWFELTADRHMSNYLQADKNAKLLDLTSPLKVRISLEEDERFPRGAFKVKPRVKEQAAVPGLRRPKARPGISSNKVIAYIRKWKKSKKRQGIK